MRVSQLTPFFLLLGTLTVGIQKYSAAAALCQDAKSSVGAVNCFAPAQCCPNGKCQVDCTRSTNTPLRAPAAGCGAIDGSGDYGAECWTCNPTDKTKCKTGIWDCFNCQDIPEPDLHFPIPSASSSSCIGGCTSKFHEPCGNLSFACPLGCSNSTGGIGFCAGPTFVGTCAVGTTGQCLKNGISNCIANQWVPQYASCCCPFPKAPTNDHNRENQTLSEELPMGSILENAYVGEGHLNKNYTSPLPHKNRSLKQTHAVKSETKRPTLLSLE